MCDEKDSMSYLQKKTYFSSVTAPTTRPHIPQGINFNIEFRWNAPFHFLIKANFIRQGQFQRKNK